VSVDPRDKARWVEEKLKAPFPLLSDSARRAMTLYGTASPEYRAPDGGPLNSPTLVLIDRTGTIRWIHQAPDFRIRPPISQDLSEARKLK
jgi:peroxiredoxin